MRSALLLILCLLAAGCTQTEEQAPATMAKKTTITTTTTTVPQKPLADYALEYINISDHSDSVQVQSISEATDGSVLFTTEKEVLRYRNGAFEKVDVSGMRAMIGEKRSRAKDPVLLQSYLETGKERWLMSKDGIAVDNGLELAYMRSPMYNADYLTLDSQGDVWLVNIQGHKSFAQYKDGKWIKHTSEQFKDHGWGSFIGEDEGKLYFTAKREIGIKPEIWSYKDGWTQEMAFGMDDFFASTDTHYILLTGFEDIVLMEKEGFAYKEKLNLKMASNFADQVFIDREGNIWVTGMNGFGKHDLLAKLS